MTEHPSYAYTQEQRIDHLRRMVVRRTRSEPGGWLIRARVVLRSVLYEQARLATYTGEDGKTHNIHVTEDDWPYDA